MKRSRLPDSVFKYSSHLRWLISPKSGFYIVSLGGVDSQAVDMVSDYET